MVIHKGEQFFVPFEIFFETTKIEPEDINGVKIKLGGRLCKYPDGELEYDYDSEEWLYPLTEEQTLKIPSGQCKAEIAIKIGSGIFKSDILDIVVTESTIKERWDDDG